MPIMITLNTRFVVKITFLATVGLTYNALFIIKPICIRSTKKNRFKSLLEFRRKRGHLVNKLSFL
jgi:hypothetical protein